MEAEPERLAREIEGVFVRRFRAVEGERWNLRRLHEIGLENFVNEILNNHECRKVVQMPTGAGKSVLMSLLALATVHVREHIREGKRRNVILVFAPLSRVKFQLLDRYITASGVYEGFRPPSFSVYCVSSDKDALRDINIKLLANEKLGKKYVSTHASNAIWVSQSRGLHSADTVSGALQMIQKVAKNEGSKYVHVVLVCPHALGGLEEDSEIQGGAYKPLETLKSQVLAVLVDEAHVIVDIKSKWGSMIAALAKNAPIALGFTATPVRETFRALTGKASSQELLLHRKPIHSYDLMLGRDKEWILHNEPPMLINGLTVRFHNTRIELEKEFRKLDKEEIFAWKGYLPERVKLYTEIVCNDLMKYFKEDIKNIKVLVLAPNTREAELWGETLKSVSKEWFGEEKVFVAHSRKGEAHSEIENFVRSYKGILVAVDMVRLGFDDPDIDALVIARPVKSMVAYVQMRGRVLRYPKSTDRPKAKKGAFILHLAADDVMEAEELVKKAESGFYSKEDVGIGLRGFYEKGEIIELRARKIEIKPIGHKEIGYKEEKTSLNKRLLDACKKGKRAKVLVKILLDRGAEVNARDEHGWTPLHHAASRDAVSILQLLLDKGADVNSKTVEGATPLHVAAASGSLNTISLLLAKGVDINARDNSGRTPLHYAAAKGSLATVKLLLKHKADPNAKDAEGRTPLQYAVERGATRIVRCLIDAHADVNARDKYGKTPLDTAREKSYRKIAEHLARAASAKTKSPQETKVNMREKTETSQEAQATASPQLRLESDFIQKSGLPLLRVKVNGGKHTIDEICVLYLYPKEKMVHVSWKDGRNTKYALGEELERELIWRLGKHVKGRDANELAKQIICAISSMQLKDATRAKGFSRQ